MTSEESIETDFSGFKGENGVELLVKLLKRKIYSLEETVYQMMERFARLEAEQSEQKSEIQSLKKELRKAYLMNNELPEDNKSLREQLKEAEEVKKCKARLTLMHFRVTAWRGVRLCHAASKNSYFWATLC